MISCYGETFFMKFNSESARIPLHMHPTLVRQHNSAKVKRSIHYFQENEATQDFWRDAAKKKLKLQLEKKLNKNTAKNVILFIGDGMSLSTVTASRIYEGQLNGKSGEENLLSFEKFDHIGLSKTYCVDKQVSDSASSATAYFTGVKANYATIGVNAKVELNDCKASLEKENQLSSFIEWAQKAGKATGVVTTTRITHASPAGAYAHIANRDWESDYDMLNFRDTKDCPDIAQQLITENPGKNLNVIFGGGRKKFIPENVIDESETRGERLDGRDLIDEWLDEKRLRNQGSAYYVYNSNGLEALLNQSPDTQYVLGLFADSHLDYHLSNNTKQPTLKEMTVAAIKLLAKNENGFVLFVEGGRIDQAHHANMAKLALDETVQLSEAVQSAVDMTDESDTLILVTADHSHTMAISGYSMRGSDILGLNSEISDIDSMSYATLSYANGPSGTRGRERIVESDMKKNDYRFPSLVPLDFETHGGDDVPIYSRGPYAHLFDGVLEQNVIPHFIAYAACINNDDDDDGNDLSACDNK